METYRIIRLDDMPEIIRIGMYYNSQNKVDDIENGKFVVLGDLEEGEREIYKATEVATTSTGLIGVVCTPEVDHDEQNHRHPINFINKKGHPIRVAIFRKNFRFSIADANVTYTKGQEVTVGDQKIKCIAIEQSGRHKYYVFECKGKITPTTEQGKNG